jgi:hypothetical protein
LDSEDRIIAKYNDETIVRIVEEDEVYEYHLHDALGSVITITNENGVVGATYDYDVFGGIRAQDGETANTLTFAGEQWDAEQSSYIYVLVTMIQVQDNLLVKIHSQVSFMTPGH